MNTHTLSKCNLIFLIIIIIITTQQKISFSNEINIQKIESIELKDEIWIGKCAEFDKFHFYCIGFEENKKNTSYLLFEIFKKEIKEIIKINEITTYTQNNYINSNNILFFNIFNNFLNIGIQNNKTDFFAASMYVGKNDVTLKSKMVNVDLDSKIYQDEYGKFHILNTKKEQNYSPIAPDTDKQADRFVNNLLPIEIISSILSQNDAIYIAANDTISKPSISKILKIDQKGPPIGETSVPGTIYNLLKTDNQNIIALASPDDPNQESKAHVFSSDLSPLASYAIPSFYESVQYQGSVTALPGGSLLYLKILPENSLGLSIIANKFSSEEIVSLGKIELDKENEALNIMEISSHQSRIFGILTKIKSDKKRKKFLYFYEFENF